MSVDTATDELLDKVKSAIHGPRDLRTVGGIYRDTGLPAQTVQEILLNNPTIFVRSRTISPSGIAVYELNCDEASVQNDLISPQ